MSTQKKYVPVLCTETLTNGKKCGGVYKSDLSGNFYCVQCGIQYQDAYGHPAEEFEGDSMYDQLDNEERTESSSMSSLYQKEQETGSLLPPALNQVEARLKRNIDAYRKAIAVPSNDELRAKDKLHEKAETDRKVRKDIKKAIRQSKVYDSKQSEKLKSNRMASIIFWTKQLKTMTIGQLHTALTEHNTELDRRQLLRLLEDLAKSGRVTLVKQEQKEGSVLKPAYIVTFVH
jgi:rubredoxin